jgi:hypothetical protein
MDKDDESSTRRKASKIKICQLAQSTHQLTVGNMFGEVGPIRWARLYDKLNSKQLQQLSV